MIFNDDPAAILNLSKETAALAAVVDEAAKRTLVGSFAERNPLLGKMTNCKVCSGRHRVNLPCVNAKWIRLCEPNPASGLTPTPRQVLGASFFARKRKNPRLTKGRPPMFELRHILLDWESEPHLTKARRAQGEIEGEPRHAVLKPIQMQHLASLAERWVLWKRRNRARKLESIKKESRRINRGN